MADEMKFTDRICIYLEAVGAMIIVNKGSASVSGVPDRLVLHPNFCGFIEFKADSTEGLRKNQELKAREIVKRGFPYFVCCPGTDERFLSATIYVPRGVLSDPAQMCSIDLLFSPSCNAQECGMLVLQQLEHIRNVLFRRDFWPAPSSQLHPFDRGFGWEACPPAP